MAESAAERERRHAALLALRQAAPKPPKYARHIPGGRRITHVPGVSWILFDIWDKVAPSLCEICDRLPGKVSLALDHDHAYRHGRPGLRGFLCGPCNGELGKYHDDPAEIDFWAAHFRRYASPDYADVIGRWGARAKAYLARTDCPHHQARLAYRLRPDKYRNPRLYNGGYGP